MGKLDLDLRVDEWRDCTWTIDLNRTHRFTIAPHTRTSSGHHIVDAQDALTLVCFIRSECFLDEATMATADEQSHAQNIDLDYEMSDGLRGNIHGDDHDNHIEDGDGDGDGDVDDDADNWGNIPRPIAGFPSTRASSEDFFASGPRRIRPNAGITQQRANLRGSRALNTNATTTAEANTNPPLNANPQSLFGITAMPMQREAIRAQREEFRAQREEFRAQREEMRQRHQNPRQQVQQQQQQQQHQQQIQQHQQQIQQQQQQQQQPPQAPTLFLSFLQSLGLSPVVQEPQSSGFPGSDGAPNGIQVGSRLFPFPSSPVQIEVHTGNYYAPILVKSREISLQGARVTFDDVSIDAAPYISVLRIHLHRDEILAALANDKFSYIPRSMDLARLVEDHNNFLPKLCVRKPYLNTSIYNTTKASTISLTETGASLNITFTDFPEHVTVHRGEVLVLDFSFTLFPETNRSALIQAFSKDCRVMNALVFSRRPNDIFIRCQPLPNDMLKISSVIVRVQVVEQPLESRGRSFFQSPPPSQTFGPSMPQQAPSDFGGPGPQQNTFRSLLLSASQGTNRGNGPATTTDSAPTPFSLQQYLIGIFDS